MIVRHQVRPDGFAIACLVDGAPAQLFELAGMSQNGTSNPALLGVFPSRGAAVDSFSAARPRSGSVARERFGLVRGLDWLAGCAPAREKGTP